MARKYCIAAPLLVSVVGYRLQYSSFWGKRKRKGEKYAGGLPDVPVQDQVHLALPGGIRPGKVPVGAAGLGPLHHLPDKILPVDLGDLQMARLALLSIPKAEKL